MKKTIIMNGGNNKIFLSGYHKLIGGIFFLLFALNTSLYSQSEKREFLDWDTYKQIPLEQLYENRLKKQLEYTDSLKSLVQMDIPIGSFRLQPQFGGEGDIFLYKKLFFHAAGYEEHFPGMGGIVKTDLYLGYPLSEQLTLYLGGYLSRYYTIWAPKGTYNRGLVFLTEYQVNNWMTMKLFGQYALYGSKRAKENILYPFVPQDHIGVEINVEPTKNTELFIRSSILIDAPKINGGPDSGKKIRSTETTVGGKINF